MSGLLSTLLAAAQGQAPAAEPRPRGRYEGADADAAGIEWRMAEAESASASPRTLAAPETGPGPTPAATAMPGQQREPRRTDAASSTHPARPFVPHRPASENDRLTPRHGPETAHDKAIADSHAAGAPSAPASLVEPFPPASTKGAEPLLPLRERERELAPATDPAAPLSAAYPAEQNGAMEARTRGSSLRIGRIEVRTPPPASTTTTPAPPSPMRVTSRPVSLPRATVRQSLDDYRHGRKR